MATSLNAFVSPCPNDTFAFGPLILNLIEWSGPKLNFHYEDIQTLNQLGLGQTPPDILKFSYGCWPRLRKHYQLLRTGSALGFGVGPLIVGQGDQPIHERERLVIPGKDTTATLLAKRYFPSAHLEEISYERIIPLLQEDSTTAGVIIHESRFTYSQNGLKLLFDLGSHWEKDTQGPLPLGGVAILKKHGPELAKKIELGMQLSIDESWNNPDELLPFMQTHAQEMSPEVMQQHVDLYVNEDTKCLSPKGEKAIQNLCSIHEKLFP